MRLEVIAGTAAEWNTALAATDASESVGDYYTHCLETACASQESVACFRSIPPEGSQSDNFALAGVIEHTIMGFLKLHEYPQTVRIVCDTTETAQLYKAVYNFWFAADKPSRMQDDDWD